MDDTPNRRAQVIFSASPKDMKAREVLRWLAANAPERGRSRLLWDTMYAAINGLHIAAQRPETLAVSEEDLDSLLDGL